MDRNTVTGLLLIGAILVGYSLWMQPSAEEIEAKKQAQDSLAQVVSEKTGEADEEQPVLAGNDAEFSENQDANSTEQAKLDSLKNAEAQKRYGSFAQAIGGTEQFHTIENDFVRLTLSSKGAAPVVAQLKNYVTFDSLPLYLFDKETSQFGFSFWANKSLELRSRDLYFEPIEMSATQAVYRLYGDSRAQYIEVTYRVQEGESYVVDANIRVVDMATVVSASEEVFELGWSIQAPVHERSRDQESRKTTVFYQYVDDKADYISEAEYEAQKLAASVKWVAFKQQYFSAAIISPTGFSKENGSVETLETHDQKYTKGMSASLGLPLPAGNEPSVGFQFYFGPNHYQTLADLGIGLEDQIDLGWTIFGWVNRWLVIPTFNFLDSYTGLSYGIIILLLTLFIKVILFPIMWRNYVSSARMRVLKPEVDAINEKMKDKDPMAKQQAVMGLYRQAGVNPMAGCVPMLLQLPILYAMFQFFPASIELRQESFLWAQDLSTYDSIFELPFEIPFYGSHVSLFTILLAISTFFYSKYNMDMGSMGSGMQASQMKMMMYLMPFMMLFFFNSYSAGLSYYYFTANVISMLQQYLIKRFFIDEEAIHRKIQNNKKKPVKKSSFQQRLEKMAKERGIQTPKR